MLKNLRRSLLLELRKFHSKMKVNRDEVDTIPICFNESGLTECILFCKEKKKKVCYCGFLSKDFIQSLIRPSRTYFKDRNHLFFSDVETPSDLESILIFYIKLNL